MANKHMGKRKHVIKGAIRERQKKRIPREKWVWMPHNGHFIMGKYCQFVLNTKVGNYIVSTVGELWPDSQVRKIHADVHKKIISGRGDEWDANYFKEFGFEEIGYGRKYETMVFKAVKSKEPCCPWVMASPSDIDGAAYNDARDAYLGHYKLCDKYSRK